MSSSVLRSPALRGTAFLAMLLAGWGWTVPPGARAEMPVGTPKTSFFSPRAVMWLGHSAVLPFRVPAAPETDQTFIATPAMASAVEVLQQPALLAGETTGFLRLRGLKAGITRLSIQGGAAIDLEIRADPAGSAFAQVDVESRQPRIVSPMPGAVVWDRFAVGVEIFDDDPRAQVHDQFHVTGEAAPPLPELTVQLRLPNGRLLDSIDSGPGASSGPTRRFAFEVNAAELRPGPFRVVAVATRPAPVDLDHRNRPGGPLESEPLPLVAQAPLPASVWVDEAENAVTDAKEVIGPARPARYGTRQPKVEKDLAASGSRMVALYGGDPAWCLPFVVKEAGDYQMMVRVRGDFGVGAYPTVALQLDNVERPVALVRLVSGKYHRLPVGTPVHLDAGPQILNVQFKNDAGSGKEDRNLYFDRYELARVSLETAAQSAQLSQPVEAGPRDASPLTASTAAQTLGRINPPVLASLTPGNEAPPRVGILYPANGAAVHGADAAVAYAGNTARITWADLLVDGQPQNERRLDPLPGEAMLFPLLARSLPPGGHRLSVRVLDAAGRAADSPAQLLTVLPAAPPNPGPYERALRLLDRFGFGPEPKELAAVLTLGEAPWLNNRLAAGFDTPVERTLLHVACAHYPQTEDANQTIARALTQWTASDNPVRARFTAWAENHFSTWMEKIGPFAKWREHLAFCRLGVAPFADLLNASAQSPAMLTYLDQEKSYAGKLNENYAREIMELHTLGVHGGYKQTDVTSLAAILNGWTLSEEATLLDQDDDAPLKISNRGDRTGMSKELRFVPAFNDGKPRQVFGLNFAPATDPASRYDRVRLAVEMLASHPSTASHICRKLAEHYVAVPAPDELVESMAAVFMQSGGDLRAVLRAMAGHPAFWSADSKVATPFDFALRLTRLSRASLTEINADPNSGLKPEQIAAFLKRSGMGLFDHVSPEGYPQNSAAYSDSNALLQRWRFLQANADVVNRLVPAHWRNVSPPAAKTVNDAAPARLPGVETAQRFIDLAAVRLNGRLLSSESNQTALDLLAPDASPAMMREVLVFISMLPENNLR